jgi:hypothetical protein
MGAKLRKSKGLVANSPEAYPPTPLKTSLTDTGRVLHDRAPKRTKALEKNQNKKEKAKCQSNRRSQLPTQIEPHRPFAAAQAAGVAIAR